MKWVLTIPRDRDPPARELLDDHRVGRQVQPHPAVLLGDGHAEQAELAHLLHDRLGELVGGVIVLRLRDDLLVDELADHLDDRLLFVGLLEEANGHRPILSLELHPRCRRIRRPKRPRAGRAARRRHPPRVDLRGARRRRASASPAPCTRRGVRQGDVVLTLIGTRPEWALTMLACFRQGYVVLPCTEQLRPKDLQLRLQRRAAPDRSSPTRATRTRSPAGPATRSGSRSMTHLTRRRRPRTCNRTTPA